VKSITMDEIASKIGISKKTLYQHAENKADLIQQVIQQHSEQEKCIGEVIRNKSLNAIDEVLGMVSYATELLRQFSPNLVYELQKYYPESWKIVDKLHNEHIFNDVKNNLERGVREGLYRTDFNIPIITKLYVAQTLHIIDESIFPNKEFAAEQVLKEFVMYHLQGVVSPKGAAVLKEINNFL
jgi:TetR/AcrR family transcriptional regulator, cholesterol catabolism regulator